MNKKLVDSSEIEELKNSMSPEEWKHYVNYLIEVSYQKRIHERRASYKQNGSRYENSKEKLQAIKDKYKNGVPTDVIEIMAEKIADGM